MPSKQEEPEFSLRDMADYLGDRLLQHADTPNMYAYKPHDKQLLFHECKMTGRLYIGGNRSGKSTAGVMEDIWWLTHTHPFLQTPEGKVRGRIVVSDFVSGWQQVVEPIFQQWIAAKYLIGGEWNSSWNKQTRRLTLIDGSFIEVKSIDQDLVKHAGTSRHFIHFDEEPPKSYFQENLLRLTDTGGSWWITMTPVDGMTWVHDDMYEPFMMGTHKGDLNIIEVDMDDNPYLSDKAKTETMAYLDEEDIEARKKGKFVQKGGLVYKDFSENLHVIKERWLPPSDWAIYQSTDHGYKNPTAHEWHAVSPNMDRIITFAEIYLSHLTIQEHATKILQLEGLMGITTTVRTGDPAMKQSSAINGMSIQQTYAQYGIYFALDSIPRSVQIGIDKVASYLRINKRTGKPFWQITKDCPFLIREMGKLHWKTYNSAKQNDANNPREEIHKKDDHACDSTRYFFTLMPELGPEQFGIVRPGVKEPTSSEPKDYITTLVEMAQMGTGTEWRTVSKGFALNGFEDNY